MPKKQHQFRPLGLILVFLHALETSGWLTGAFSMTAREQGPGSEPGTGFRG